MKKPDEDLDEPSNSLPLPLERCKGKVTEINFEVGKKWNQGKFKKNREK